MTNLPPSNPPIGSAFAVERFQRPASPAASMQTNPSATNPLHQNTSDFGRAAQGNSSFTNLPHAALANQYNPQSSRFPQSPSVGSGSGFLLSTPQKKAGRSTSMVVQPSVPVYFDHVQNSNNNSSTGAPSTDNSVAGGSVAHPAGQAGVRPAPTSIPPDLALQQPPVNVSVFESSEPKLFPGIISKSRTGSVTLAHPIMSSKAEENDDMPKSLPTLRKVDTEGATSAVIAEESGDEYASAEDE